MDAILKNIHLELIERCKRKDQQAQMQLYQLYSKAMFNVSLRFLPDRHEAEDVLQEAFLKAFTRLHTLQDTAAFGGWLKRIVISQSLDALKKKKEHWLEETAVAIPAPEEEVPVPQLDVEQVRAAIQRLPDGYRVILSLYLLEGYDHEEISEILQITPSTSRSQYTRAKRKLRDSLTPNAGHHA